MGSICNGAQIFPNQSLTEVICHKRFQGPFEPWCKSHTPLPLNILEQVHASQAEHWWASHYKGFTFSGLESSRVGQPTSTQNGLCLQVTKYAQLPHFSTITWMQNESQKLFPHIHTTVIVTDSLLVSEPTSVLDRSVSAQLMIAKLVHQRRLICTCCTFQYPYCCLTLLINIINEGGWCKLHLGICRAGRVPHISTKSTQPQKYMWGNQFHAILIKTAFSREIWLKMHLFLHQMPKSQWLWVKWRLYQLVTVRIKVGKLLALHVYQ